jgi:hypothetical protein
MQSLTRHPTLEHLAPMEGEWQIEATHQALPGTIHGRATFEWLDGGLVLIWRASYDHPDMPDSIALLTCGVPGDRPDPSELDEGCTMQYADQRGVTRIYQLSAEPGGWRFWRDYPGFSQRFTGAFSPDGTTLSGIVELNRDGVNWEEDLPITYTRIEG